MTKSRKYALIVENNQIARQAIEIALASQNIEGIPCRDSLEAIKLAHTDLDLVIIEYNTPGLNSEEAADFIHLKRELAGLKRLPIICLSGYAASYIEKARISPVFASYITRPFSPALLAAKVEELFLPESA